MDEHKRRQTVSAAWWQLALLGLIAMVLLGTTVLRPSAVSRPALPVAPPGVAALVDGQEVPLSLYRRQVGIYRATLPPPDDSSVAARAAWEDEVEDRALRQAIAETIIAREAARRGLVASPAAIAAALDTMRAEAGSVAALQEIARSEHLSQSDLWAMARTSVLDDLLTRHTGDGGLVDRLYLRAHVTYFVGPRAGSRTLAPAPQAGHPAPALTATTLDGQTAALSDLRGAPVVLTMWSTGCTWCRMEMSELDRFAHNHPGIHVVALDVGEDHTAVASFAHSLNLHLPIWLDLATVSPRTYGLNGLPDTFVIDSAGIIRAVIYGALVNPNTLQNAVVTAGG